MTAPRKLRPFVTALALLSSVIAVATAPRLAGAEVCGHLQGEEREKYETFRTSGADLLHKDPLKALSFLMGAQRKCSEDVELLEDLTAAALELHDCHMARWWLEQILARENGPEELREKSLQKVTELENTCPHSAIIRIQSDTPEVTVVMASVTAEGLELVSLPFEGRVEATTFEITASKPGYKSVVMDVDLAPNVAHDIRFRPLILEDSPARLQVRCRDGEDDLQRGVVDTDLCAVDDLLDPEGETLKLQVEGVVQTVETVAKENRVNDLRVPTPNQTLGEMQLSDWGWLALGSGAILVGSGVVLQMSSNDLYDQAGKSLKVYTGQHITPTQKQANATVGRANLIGGVGLTSALLGAGAIVTGVALILWPESPYEPQVSSSLGGEQAAVWLDFKF